MSVKTPGGPNDWSNIIPTRQERFNKKLEKHASINENQHKLREIFKDIKNFFGEIKEKLAFKSKVEKLDYKQGIIYHKIRTIPSINNLNDIKNNLNNSLKDVQNKKERLSIENKIRYVDSVLNKKAALKKEAPIVYSQYTFYKCQQDLKPIMKTLNEAYKDKKPLDIKQIEKEFESINRTFKKDKTLKKIESHTNKLYPNRKTELSSFKDDLLKAQRIIRIKKLEHELETKAVSKTTLTSKMIKTREEKKLKLEILYFRMESKAIRSRNVDSTKYPSIVNLNQLHKKMLEIISSNLKSDIKSVEIQKIHADLKGLAKDKNFKALIKEHPEEKIKADYIFMSLRLQDVDCKLAQEDIEIRELKNELMKESGKIEDEIEVDLTEFIPEIANLTKAFEFSTQPELIENIINLKTGIQNLNNIRLALLNQGQSKTKVYLKLYRIYEIVENKKIINILDLMELKAIILSKHHQLKYLYQLRKDSLEELRKERSENARQLMEQKLTQINNKINNVIEEIDNLEKSANG